MPRVISNSEVTAYNECARRHWYQYVEGLQPRSYGLALTRGIIGHHILEAYYKSRMLGHSVDESKVHAFELLRKIIADWIKDHPTEYEKLSMLSDLYKLLEMYFEFYRGDNFNILSVENTYIASVDPEFSYGMKLDLLIKIESGIHAGETVVMDHKFIYNFKSDEELSIDGQLPKYIRTTAAAEGIGISRGVFNQIRYRELKNPDPEMIFRRTWIKPTAEAKEQIWQEQIAASEEIVRRPRAPRRTLSPLVCKNCYFLQICSAELNGRSTATARLVDYEPLKDRYLDWSGD